MRIKIITVIIFLMNSYPSFAQEKNENLIKCNSQWAPIGAEWYFTYNFRQIPGPGGSTYTKFQSIKDTLISNVTCRLIRETRNFNCSGEPDPLTKNHIMIAEGGRVYEVWNDVLFLLYDFNKNPGEYWILPKYDYDTVFVDSVKMITLTNGEIRKAQYVTTNAYDKIFSGMIIENIGFELSLFPFLPKTPCEDGGPLRCYLENGNHVLTNYLPCDHQTVGTYDLINTAEKIRVNTIVNDILKIDFIDHLLLPVQSITILNNMGAVIYRQQHVVDQQILINLLNEKNGFYFLMIENNNEFFNFKIIKL